MQSGKVLNIFISEAQGGRCVSLPVVEAIAAQGLVGDRYCIETNDLDGNHNAITFQALEAIAACNKDLDSSFLPEDFRRNIITRGIDLNSLVGRKFRVADVLLQGYELCHPCKYLVNLLQKDVLQGLCNRGGLRARILQSGTISVGDSVAIVLEDDKK